MVEHQVVHPLGAQHQRHLVDVVHVAGRDHRLLRHAAEERDLAADLALQPALRPADDRLRLDPDPPQLVDRMLRRLGLQLAGMADVRHQGQVHEHAALRPEVRVELADRLQEGQRLDVSHRAADLRDHEVDRLRLGQDQDPLLDLVGDVGDHLDGRAEVVAAALAPDHRVVDGARGDVRGPRGVLVREPLVVAEVEVRLRPILGDEHLAVLEGAHGPRIDVDVGVELLQLDPEAAADQQPPDRGRGDPLAERGDDAAGDEDEPGLAGLHLPGSAFWPSVNLPSESRERSSGTLSIVREIERNSP